MDAARIDTGSRIGNTAVATGIGVAAVAVPTGLATAMFTQPRYGESFGRAVTRASMPVLTAFAIPTAVGALAGSLTSTSEQAIGTGAIAGGITGAALGATMLHRSMTAGMTGPGPSRLLTAALFGVAGAITGTMGGALATTAVEH